MIVRQVYNFDETNIPMWVYTLFWGVYVLGVLYSVRKFLFSPQRLRSQMFGSYVFILYFILFAIFYCVGTDYFRYRDWIYGRDFRFWAKENVYIVIIYLCRTLPGGYPYEFFRLIVWGSAILTVYLSSFLYGKRLKPGLVVFFLFVLYSSTFCYARVSLAMAIYFLGISLITKVDIKYKLLGFVVAFCSYFFHHELIIGIAVLPCLYIHFEKKEMYLVSFVFLLFIIVAVTYINNNLDLLDMIFGDKELSSKIEGFNEAEQRSFRVSTVIKYLTYFYPLYIVAQLMMKKICLLPKKIIILYRITFSIIMFSVAFMIVVGPRSVYAYRVLYIGMVPISIMMAYCYNSGMLKKTQIVIMLSLAILSNSVNLINA